MTKRFKLHIDWFNYDKTDGEATLSDNGQPLLESDCVEDMRRLKDLLNELNDKNEQLKSELGKLNILYKAKCKTEEQLIEMGKEVEKENEQLKSDNKCYVKRYSELFDDYIDCKKENEQLKQQIKDMQIRFKRKYDYEFDEIVDELDLGDVN